MLHLLEELGFEIHRVVTGSEVEVAVELGAGRGLRGRPGLARPRRRRRIAAAAVRAARHRGRRRIPQRRRPSGTRCSRTSSRAATPGGIYPVNPSADQLAGLPAHPTVSAVPGAVDLAVICVPAARVLGAVDDCIAAGVRAIAVVSAGFGETSAAGAALEIELRDRCRAASVRLVGPNCLGSDLRPAGLRLRRHVRADRARRPAASRSPRSRGRSGSRCWSRPTTSASASRRSSPSATAPTSRRTTCSRAGRTIRRPSVIALYVESFGNPRKFSRIARRVTAHKPVVALKAGRSTAGARAAASHTAALAAKERRGRRPVPAGRCRPHRHDRGAVRRRPAASPTSRCRPGNRVAIVTNAGGFGDPLRRRVRGGGTGGRGAGRRDAGATGVVAAARREYREPRRRDRRHGPGRVRRGAPRGVRRPGRRRRGGAPRADRDDRPGRHRGRGGQRLAARCDASRCWPAWSAPATSRAELNAGRGPDRIPCFAFPESAARALGHAAHLAAFRRRPRGAVVRFDDIDLRHDHARCASAPWTAATTRGCRRPPCAPSSPPPASGSRRPPAPPPRTRPPRRSASCGSNRAVVKIVAHGVQHKTRGRRHPARDRLGERRAQRVRARSAGRRPHTASRTPSSA